MKWWTKVKHKHKYIWPKNGPPVFRLLSPRDFQGTVGELAKDDGRSVKSVFVKAGGMEGKLWGSIWAGWVANFCGSFKWGFTSHLPDPPPPQPPNQCLEPNNHHPPANWSAIGKPLFGITRTSTRLTNWPLALTLLMWPWWVMIPTEDFIDVAVGSEEEII